MNILLYLIILLAGALIGHKKWIREKWLDKIGEVQILALLFLLFIMGINIGVDQEVILSFGRIGLNAFILSIFSIVFSIVGVKMISKMVLEEGERIKSDN